ncbi:MAG TPA: TetR/AcrR family transcriptional regulator [Cytophagaceae bacterium]|nr:TetR/AcrR family transcriptional regulator [Cytophagaceae bacterium]
MSGRPKIFNEEEILDKAIEVFWKNGYEASSTEILLDAMGIGKSSFYLAFKGGKRELFEKALERRSDLSMGKLQRELDESENKIEFLKSFFMEVLDPSSKRFLNGCLMGNSIAELANIDLELKTKASSLLLRLEKVFATALKEAKKDGTLKAKENPELLAKYLLTVWNGLNISIRVYPDPKLLKPIVEKQLQVLE